MRLAHRAPDSSYRVLVGLPDEFVAQLRHAPCRSSLEAMAHTLSYEAEVTVTRQDVASLQVPTLVIAGTATVPGLLETARAPARALPDASLSIFEGQTHDIVPSVLGPVLEGSFGSRAQRTSPDGVDAQADRGRSGG